MRALDCLTEEVQSACPWTQEWTGPERWQCARASLLGGLAPEPPSLPTLVAPSSQGTGLRSQMGSVSWCTALGLGSALMKNGPIQGREKLI